MATASPRFSPRSSRPRARAAMRARASPQVIRSSSWASGESWMMKSRSSGARESRMAARLLTVMTLRASRRLCRSAAVKGRAAVGLVGGHDLHEAFVHALRRRKHEGDRLGDVLGQQALVALVEALAALVGV